MANKATANNGLTQINRTNRHILDEVEKERGKLSPINVGRFGVFKRRDSEQTDTEDKSSVLTTEEEFLFKGIEKQRGDILEKSQGESKTRQAELNVLIGKSNIIDFLEYREKKRSNNQSKKPVTTDETIGGRQLEPGEEKSDRFYSRLEQISHKRAEDLGGDQIFEDKLTERLVETVVDDLKTEDEQVRELKNFINGNVETSNLSTDIEAKTIVLELKKIEEDHSDEVREVRGRNLLEKVGDREIGEVAKDVLYGSEGFNKNDLVLNNSQKNLQLEIQTVTGLLSKTPDEVKRIKDKYKNAKDRLNGVLPFTEVPQLIVLDRVLNTLDDQKINQSFDLIQRGGWINKIKNFNNNQLANSVVETAGGFITRVGRQTSRDFIKNSVGILSSGGFYSGFKKILSGIINGGVNNTFVSPEQNLLTTYFLGGTSGGFGSWLGSGSNVVFGKVGNGLRDIGFDLAGKLKNGLKSGLSKYLGILGGSGALTSAAVATTGSAAMIAVSIIIIVMGVLFFSNTGSAMISTKVPPVGVVTKYSPDQEEESTDLSPGDDNTTIPAAVKCSVADKVVLTAQCSAENKKVRMRADGKYSDKNICTSGCGPTATSEILQGQNSIYKPSYLMTNSQLTTLSGEKVSNPYYNTYTGYGTTMGMARTTLSRVMGSDKVTSVVSCNVSVMRDLICKGMAVVVHMKYYVDGDRHGHYAVAVAADGNSNIWIKDNGNGNLNIYPKGSYYKPKNKIIDYCFGVKVKETGVL